MKILVANEHEKELVERFIEQYTEDNEIGQLIESKCDEYKLYYGEETVDGTDAIFLQNGFMNAKVAISNDTWDMEVDYESVLDTCKKCKQQMCINMDFDDVTYEDYCSHSYGNSYCLNCGMEED